MPSFPVDLYVHDTPLRDAAASLRALLFGERTIRIGDVAALLPPRPDGRRVGKSTIHRWALRGVRGVVLESARAPFGKITSLEAVERFIDRLNQIDPAARPLRPLNRRRRRRAEGASRYVRAALGLREEVQNNGGDA
jgi:hypothetical protein